MAATFSSAVSATAPAVLDPTASQDTGAVSTGIGLGVGDADGTLIANQRIGGEAFDLRVETDANLATPI